MSAPRYPNSIPIPALPKTMILVGFWVIIAIVFLWTTIYIVPADSVGVVQRFGAFSKTVDPGLQFKIPYGVDTVTLVQWKRQLKMEFGFGTRGSTNRYQESNQPDLEKAMVTGDLNAALVEFVVQYHISNPRDYLFAVRDSEETMRAAAEAVMREIIGDRTVDEVITIGRQEIESDVQANLQKVASDYALGLAIDTVQLKNVNPPREVQSSFDEVNQAQQEKQRAINIADGEYNKAVPRASGEAEQVISQARGYALKRVNEAEGDALRFGALLAEYQRAPEIMRQRLYLETMIQVMPTLERRIIVDDKGQQVLPFLQLSDDKKGNYMANLRSLGLAALFLFVLIGFNLCTYTVNEYEQAILTQFGKPVGEPVTTAGLHFKLPFIQTVYPIEKRILEWDGHASEMPTRDKLYIIVDTFGRWRIKDPLKYFITMRDEKSAQSRLDDILGSEVRNALAKHDLIEIVRTDKDRKPIIDEGLAEGVLASVLPPIKIGRTVLERDVVKEATPKLEQFGIELIDVRFMRINYNQRVTAKIYERMISERQKIASRFRSEGEGEAAKILGNKERELKKIESEAYREVQKIRGEADARAAAIYAGAYNATPEAASFYQFMRTMESYPAVLAGSTLILSTDSELLRFFKSTTPAKVPPPAAPATVPANPPAP